MKTNLIYADGLNVNSVTPQNYWFFEERVLGPLFHFLVATDLGRRSILGFVLTTQNEPGLGDCAIMEFCDELLKKNGLPEAIYSNTKFKISDWCLKNEIQLVEGSCPVEISGADALEYSFICAILHQRTSRYQKWRQSLPTHLKGISSKKKAQNDEFKKLLYESPYFQKDVKVLDFLKKGMFATNEKLATTPTCSSPGTLEKVAAQNAFQKLSDEVLPNQSARLGGLDASFLVPLSLQAELLKKIENLEVEHKKNLARIQELENDKNKMEKAIEELGRQSRLTRGKRGPSPPFLKEYWP